MNLTQYLSFDVQFDLTGYPTLKITDTSTYPQGTVGQKVWYQVLQPDGIEVPYGDTDAPNANPSIPLRLDSEGKHLRGQYVVTMYVTHESDLATFSRIFQFEYTELDIKLVEDFDLFTPAIKYRDETLYDEVNYDITASTINWTAAIGDPLIGNITGNTSVFDMKYNGNYYSAVHVITFDRQLTYRHEVYAWLTVKDRYQKNIITKVVEPPTVPQLFQSLNLFRDELASKYGCGCGCGQEQQHSYMLAESLLSNVVLSLSQGITTGLYDLLQHFINTTQNIFQTVTNDILNAYNFTTVGTGSGAGATKFYDFDIPDDCNTFNVAILKDRVVVSIRKDGVERKVIEGNMTQQPTDDTFIFEKSTGNFSYGGTLAKDTWIKIEYQLL